MHQSNQFLSSISLRLHLHKWPLDLVKELHPWSHYCSVAAHWWWFSISYPFWVCIIVVLLATLILASTILIQHSNLSLCEAVHAKNLDNVVYSIYTACHYLSGASHDSLLSMVEACCESPWLCPQIHHAIVDIGVENLLWLEHILCIFLYFFAVREVVPQPIVEKSSG